MAKSAPENPEASRDRDFLRRWPLAQTIYSLILESPTEWCIRVGIYGKWGEGKTTVLKFIESLAQKDGLPVAWFNPWACRTREELWEGFAIALNITFASKKKLNPLKVKQGVSKLINWGSKAAKLDPVAKVLSELANPLIRRTLAIDKLDVEKLLATELKDKKLIIVIDDLDRANPEITPHLLLALREVFDIPQCAFVIALDPVVIARGLSHVHLGWGNAPEFLEKIIDFPFWLPTISDLQPLINAQVKESPLALSSSSLDEVGQLLPTNPRQLKQFFRRLWRYKSQIQRHDEDELSWTLLLIIELLRTVSNEAANRLLNSDRFLDELLKSSFAGSIEKASEKTLGPEKWVEIAQEIIAEECLPEERDSAAREMVRILNSLKTAIFLKEKSSIIYWSKICEEPPIFTWKEFRQLIRFWKQDMTKEQLRNLIDAHAALREASQLNAYQEFFDTVLAYRETALERASDVAIRDDLLSSLQDASIALSAIEVLVSDPTTLSGSSPLLTSAHFIRLFQQFGKWAHFVNDDEYLLVRGKELGVLLEAAKHCSSIAVEVLESLRIYDSLERMEGEANNLKAKLVEVLLPFLFDDLKTRFEKEGGVRSLWGHNKHLVHKWVLYRKDSGFYSKDCLAHLKTLVKQVPRTPHIQENCIQFLTMLAYGITKGLNPLGHEDLELIKSDKEIIGLMWEGAIANRLQPRALGTFKETRKTLLDTIPEECMPLPKWW